MDEEWKTKKVKVEYKTEEDKEGRKEDREERKIMGKIDGVEKMKTVYEMKKQTGELKGVGEKKIDIKRERERKKERKKNEIRYDKEER